MPSRRFQGIRGLARSTRTMGMKTMSMKCQTPCRPASTKDAPHRSTRDGGGDADVARALPSLRRGGRHPCSRRRACCGRRGRGRNRPWVRRRGEGRGRRRGAATAALPSRDARRFVTVCSFLFGGRRRVASRGGGARGLRDMRRPRRVVFGCARAPRPSGDGAAFPGGESKGLGYPGRTTRSWGGWTPWGGQGTRGSGITGGIPHVGAKAKINIKATFTGAAQAMIVKV